MVEPIAGAIAADGLSTAAARRQENPDRNGIRRLGLVLDEARAQSGRPKPFKP
jgi:hypothetical protein